MSNASALLELAKTRRIVLATVESCTGGLIANRITDVAGSSQNFWGAWIVYDITAKQRLGVPARLIHEKNAVSSEVAQALAETGLQKLQSALHTSDPGDLGIVQPWNALAVVSTTGIAGPTGGSPERPVGLCFCGLALQVGNQFRTLFKEIRSPHGMGRIQNKEFFASEALEFLQVELNKLRQ